MIIWMMWSVLVAALIALAANAAEHVAAHYRFARRFIWVTAIALAALAPLIVAVLPARVAGSARNEVRDTGANVRPLRAAGVRVTFTEVGFYTPSLPRSTDVWAIRIWLLMSV